MQDGLRIVIPMMRQGDLYRMTSLKLFLPLLCFFFQHPIAKDPSGFFHRKAMLLCIIRHPAVRHKKRHGKLLAQLSDKRFIPVRFCSPDSVMNMNRPYFKYRCRFLHRLFTSLSQCQIPKGGILCQLLQNLQKANRICPAGNRHDHRVPWGDHMLFSDIISNSL